MKTSTKASFTRQELFDLVWSKPTSKLRKETGVSDVAVAKACKKFDIPKPPRGHWQKRQYHYRTEKPKLPEAPEGLPDMVVFNKGDFIGDSARDGASKIPMKAVLPETEDELNELAQALHAKLNGAEADETGMLKVGDIEVPSVSVSKAHVWRAVQAVHCLFEFLQPLEVGRGYMENDKEMLFTRDGASVKLSIHEQSEEAGPKLERRATGYLALYIDSHYNEGRSTWNESPKQPLEWIVSNMAKRINTTLEQRYVVALENERRRAEREREEAIENHPKLIKAHKEDIVSNLERATYWWTRSEELRKFLESCQARWLDEQPDGLTAEQEQWIEWAGGAIYGMSPFAKGYPKPAMDGPVDYEQIEIGGPYPEITELSEIPKMSVIEKDTGYSYGGRRDSAREYRYPFWLKHQK